MSSQKISEDQGTALLAVQVTPEDFKPALLAAHRKNARHFQVPGFRKGKVPYPIVVNHYGEGVLYDDAIEVALPKAYEEALKEQEIAPYSDPRFDVKAIGSQEGLVFEVSVALKPQVTLGTYEGVTAYRPPVELDPGAVDEKIEEARQKVSRLVPVTDRAIEKGDQVTLDYQGFHDDVPFEGGQAEGHQLEIGSASFIPGFEEGLIGHQSGDEFDLPLTFPEAYHAEDLAGQDVIFKIKVHDVFVKELPDIDDEFVRDVSETCDSLEEYREAIRQELLQAQEEAADAAFEQNIIDQIVDNSQVLLSDLIVEDEVDRGMESQQQQFAMYGLNFADFLQYSGKSLADYRADQGKRARRIIESAWVIENIREKEEARLTLTEEDLEEAIQEAAEKEGISAEVFRQQYLKTDQDLEHFRHDQENARLLDWLKSISQVTDVAPPPAQDQDHDHDHEDGDESEEVQD